MKKYHYCFLMGTIIIAPQINEYMAMALSAMYMVFGILNSTQDV